MNARAEGENCILWRYVYMMLGTIHYYSGRLGRKGYCDSGFSFFCVFIVRKIEGSFLGGSVDVYGEG